MSKSIEELCSRVVELRKQRAEYRIRFECADAEIKILDDQIDRWALNA